MSIRDLQEAVLDQGIRHTNFFEGRLLTGDDLRNQREANREIDRRLAKALGPGIIEGLEVEFLPEISSASEPKISVSKGLAINKNGDVFGLPDNDITLQLVRSLKTPVFDKSDFYLCAGPPGEQQLPSGAGIYMLVMYPVAGYTEKAPKSGLGDSGIARGCGNKYIQEGVEFRLVQVDRAYILEHLKDKPQLVSLLDSELLDENNPIAAMDLQKQSRLRNLLASLFLGSIDAREILKPSLTGSAGMYWQGDSPFVRSLYDLELQESCDVPLGLIFWTLEGVSFIDSWTVRRPIVNHWLADHEFDINNLLSIWQFEQQLLSASNLESLKLRDYYLFIPAMFRLPVHEPDLNSDNGVDIRQFLGNWDSRLPEYVSSEELPNLLNHAIRYPSLARENLDAIQTVYVKDNLQAVRDGNENQLYAYFVHRQTASQFCFRAYFPDDNILLEAEGFIAQFKEAARVYQEFQHLVFLRGLNADEDIRRQDVLGLQVIDAVVAEFSAAVHTLESGCVSNHALYSMLNLLAHRQAGFSEFWQELLDLPPIDAYASPVRGVLDEVDDLINLESVSGFRGLLSALLDHDIVSAYLTQQRILQTFVLNLDTGISGALLLTYTQPPVNQPEEGGEAPLLVPGEYVFGFNLNSRTTGPGSFRFSVDLEQFGWEYELLDEDNNVQPLPYDFELQGAEDPAGIDTLFKVRVNVPAGGEPDALLTVRAEEWPAGGSVTPRSTSLTLQQGGLIPFPDDRFLLWLFSFGSGGSAATPFQGGIAIPRVPELPAVFTAIGFLIQLDPEQLGEITEANLRLSVGIADQSSWEILQLSGSAPATPTIRDITLTPTDTEVVVTLTMRPGSLASGNTDLVLQLDSTGTLEPPFSSTFRLPVFIEG